MYPLVCALSMYIDAEIVTDYFRNSFLYFRNTVDTEIALEVDAEQNKFILR